jgi:5'-nucleotidase
MKILLTNEAGCFTPGIVALAKELSKDHRVCIVAPLTPLRGAGHTITTDEHPLHAKQWFVLSGIKIWSVDGTPADCITLALDKLLKSKPDLIISGIDSQNNRGEIIYSSGIVSAAIEGAIQGIKSLAISADVKDEKKESEFRPIAAMINRKLDYFVSCVPERGAVNVNFPKKPVAKKIIVTHLTDGLIDNKYDIEVNPFGQTFAWLKSSLMEYGLDALEKRGDLYWLKNGCITVTPLKLDLLKAEAVAEVRRSGIKV